MVHENVNGDDPPRVLRSLNVFSMLVFVDSTTERWSAGVWRRMREERSGLISEPRSALAG